MSELPGQSRLALPLLHRRIRAKNRHSEQRISPPPRFNVECTLLDCRHKLFSRDARGARSSSRASFPGIRLRGCGQGRPYVTLATLGTRTLECRMNDQDLVWIGATELGRRIAAGETTSYRAASAYLGRISALDSSL